MPDHGGVGSDVYGRGDGALTGTGTVVGDSSSGWSVCGTTIDVEVERARVSYTLGLVCGFSCG